MSKMSELHAEVQQDERVARAVNSHDALVTALTNLKQYVDAQGWGQPWAGRPHALMDEVSAALSLASGGA